MDQIKNDYQNKDDKMIPYKKLIDTLRNYFTFVTFDQISRAENKVADAMATLASILQLQEHKSRFEFLVEELGYPNYDSLTTKSFVLLLVMTLLTMLPFTPSSATKLFSTT